MNDDQRQRLADRIAELDEIVPETGGKLKITGGWPEPSKMHADRTAYLRLGLMLLHAGIDSSRSKKEIDSELFVSDSQFKFTELVVIEQREAVAKLSKKDDQIDRATAKAGLAILAYAIGVIVVATVLITGVYYLTHILHHAGH